MYSSVESDALAVREENLAEARYTQDKLQYIQAENQNLNVKYKVQIQDLRDDRDQ